LKTENKNSADKTMVVKSRTENLSEIREFIHSTANRINIPPEVLDDITLAVDEACTNIIKHAYKFYPDGEIIVKVKYSDKKFEIKIIDHGESFHPDPVPKPDLEKYYQQRRVGGLGMYLMKSLMDKVEYISIPGKYNECCLIKNLNSSAGNGC